MTPSDALFARIQMAEGQVRASRRFAASKAPRDGDWMIQSMGAAERLMLVGGSVYTWRSDLLGAAISAAEHLPSPVTLATQGLVPSPTGLYIFENPVPFQGCSKHVGGVGWGMLGEYLCVWVYIPTSGTKWSDMGPLAAYATFVAADGIDVDIQHGEGFTDMRHATTDADFDQHTGRQSVLRFILSSWLWLKQSVMLAAPSIANHSARKAAVRAGVVPGINVVMLRRAESSGKPNGDGEGRDYSCQWLVRGHWRQQFYPSTSERRPLWIEPYVKGPDDAPFKPPSETVFVVNR